VHARLVLYKRIASAADAEELELLREEVIDRFGQYAEPVQNLFRVAACKLEAQALGIRRIDFGRQGGVVEFKPNPTVDPGKVIKLIQSGARYRLEGQDKLRLRLDMPDAEARFGELSSLLERLG
jgi:transcription-repair coupling factor (superfamily II helicase)